MFSAVDVFGASRIFYGETFSFCCQGIAERMVLSAQGSVESRGEAGSEQA